jgi:rare lipoprotein A
MSFTSRCMNQQLIRGLTATLLLTATPLTVLRSNAETGTAVTPGVVAHPKTATIVPQPGVTPQEEPPSQIGEAVKLGEQQPQTQISLKAETIAKIHAHSLSGRQAATLYIRKIPVLTFVGQPLTASGEVKLGETQANRDPQTKLKSGALAWVEPSTKNGQTAEAAANSSPQSTTDPIAKANAIAAKLNQLYREGIDASSITVSWQAADQSKQSPEQYVIKANKVALVSVDADTLLPDTTNSPEQDALQVTNRLRRLLGGADPIRDVQNKPNPVTQIVSSGVAALTGWASWYGPGFHGNLTANGEVYNQYGMTAAHRSLPFGTFVQVTNLDNGRSVVVRITDRGPFVGDRVIDLSAGAADVIGLVNSGVAPVRLDIMSRRRAGK